MVSKRNPELTNQALVWVNMQFTVDRLRKRAALSGAKYRRREKRRALSEALDEGWGRAEKIVNEGRIRPLSP